MLFGEGPSLYFRKLQMDAEGNKGLGGAGCQNWSSIIIDNLNQSSLLQNDSRFIFIGTQTYNRESQNHNHKFSSKEEEKN